MSVRRFRRAHDFLVGDVFATVANVLSNRHVEEHGLLTDDADVIAQPVHIQILQLMTIKKNLERIPLPLKLRETLNFFSCLAFLGIVESLYELYDCALAASAGTDKGQRLAAADF